MNRFACEAKEHTLAYTACVLICGVGGDGMEGSTEEGIMLSCASSLAGNYLET